MIPKSYISEWRHEVPWIHDNQVEQDLLISRVLVELFSNSDIANSLAFRGGTALYKLFLTPAPRYSEDIDLVQTNAQPIGDVLSKLRKVLDPLLGKPKRKFGAGRVSIFYRFTSEENTPLRLKIEINTREHFTVLGISKKAFGITSSWFRGKTLIPTYHLEELMGTKLRAFYQRRKGRDLFDLWYVFKYANLSAKETVEIFYQYLEKQNLNVSRAEFEQNLSEKAETDLYVNDIHPLLAPDIREKWNVFEALEFVNSHIISLLRGEAWKGIPALHKTH